MVSIAQACLAGMLLVVVVVLLLLLLLRAHTAVAGTGNTGTFHEQDSARDCHGREAQEGAGDH